MVVGLSLFNLALRAGSGDSVLFTSTVDDVLRLFSFKFIVLIIPSFDLLLDCCDDVESLNVQLVPPCFSESCSLVLMSCCIFPFIVMVY